MKEFHLGRMLNSMGYLGEEGRKYIGSEETAHIVRKRAIGKRGKVCEGGNERILLLDLRCRLLYDIYPRCSC